MNKSTRLITLCSRFYEMHIQTMSKAFVQMRTYMDLVSVNKSRAFREKLKMCGDISVRGHPISLFPLIRHSSGMRDNNNKVRNCR